MGLLPIRNASKRGRQLATLTLLAAGAVAGLPAADAAPAKSNRWATGHCIYDQVTTYRITYTAHYLYYNEANCEVELRIGFPQQNNGQPCVPDWDPGYTTQFTVDWTANLQGQQEDCIDTTTTVFEAVTPRIFDYECGQFSAPEIMALGPSEFPNYRGEGIATGPDAIGIGPTDPCYGGWPQQFCADIDYQVDWTSPTEYTVSAKVVGVCSAKGSQWIIVEQGMWVTPPGMGPACATCQTNAPDDGSGDPGGGGGNDGPFPGSGGGGPNGETGPDYPGGPDNPEGLVCCHLEDGSNIEVTYSECVQLEGLSWSPAPCEEEGDDVVCCVFPDGNGGYTQETMPRSACESLPQSAYTMGPCNDEGGEGCLECCLAILAEFQSWNQSIRIPLRNFLLEDFPEFQQQLLNALAPLANDDPSNYTPPDPYQPDFPDDPTAERLDEFRTDVNSAVPSFSVTIDTQPEGMTIDLPLGGGRSLPLDLDFTDSTLLAAIRNYSDPLLLLLVIVGCTRFVLRSLERS